MTTPDNRYVHRFNQTMAFPATNMSHSQADNARQTTEAIRHASEHQRKQAATQPESTIDGFAEREAQWQTYLVNVISEKEALHLYVARLKQEIAGHHQQADALRAELTRKGEVSEESAAAALVKQESDAFGREGAGLATERAAWAEEKTVLAPRVEALQAPMGANGKSSKWEGKVEGVRLQDEVENLQNGMDESHAKDLKSLRYELERSRQAHADISRQLTETRAALQDERVARQQLAAEVDRLNKAHAEDQRELDDAELLSKWVRGEYERMRNSEEEARKEVESLKATVFGLQAQIASARDGAIEPSPRTQASTMDPAVLTENAIQAEKNLNTLQKEPKELRADNMRKQIKINSLQAENQSLRSTVTECRASLQAYEYQYQTLQAEAAALFAERNRLLERAPPQGPERNTAMVGTYEEGSAHARAQGIQEELEATRLLVEDGEKERERLSAEVALLRVAQQEGERAIRELEQQQVSLMAQQRVFDSPGEPTTPTTLRIRSRQADPPRPTPSLSEEIYMAIAGFLAGDNAYQSLANLGLASRGLQKSLSPIIYETLIFDDDTRGGAYGIQASGWKHTKHVFLTAGHVERLRQLDIQWTKVGKAQTSQVSNSLLSTFPNLRFSLIWSLRPAPRRGSGDTTEMIRDSRLEIYRPTSSPVLHQILRRIRLRYWSARDGPGMQLGIIDGITEIKCHRHADLFDGESVPAKDRYHNRMGTNLVLDLDYLPNVKFTPTLLDLVKFLPRKRIERELLGNQLPPLMLSFRALRTDGFRFVLRNLDAILLDVPYDLRISASLVHTKQGSIHTPVPTDVVVKREFPAAIKAFTKTALLIPVDFLQKRDPISKGHLPLFRMVANTTEGIRLDCTITPSGKDAAPLIAAVVATDKVGRPVDLADNPYPAHATGDRRVGV